MLDGTPPLSSFATEFARLNTRQREAVTHPDGPVLVVAGPGTGKTQLLAARVAWLLQQPDARPQEILCLTYTEAAARNMRERLLRFIGPAGHRVAIHTFHSFGQLIISENAERLGYHDLTVASELELELLFRELIDGLPEGHALRRDSGGDPYYEIKRLKPLLETMNREGWSEAMLAEKLEEYRLGLPLDDEYIYKVAVKSKGTKAGDVKQDKLAAEEQRIELTAAAIQLFEPYRRALLARQRYTYDDMLGWATKLLTDDESLLHSYQERFQHFLVDEYQDTNGAQSHLLHLLAGYWDNPSVLVVGDDDQSIYRFQGASVANVLDFTTRYPSARTVVLEENYRSSAAVLTAAEALIAHNQERLTRQIPDMTKQLVARHPRFAASTVAAPVLRSYDSPLHEAAHVADEIAALHQAGWPAGGGAVLVHNHDQHDLLAKLLTAAGVPYQRSRKVNLLTTEPLAASLHRALTYLAAALLPDPALAEAALFNVLHLDALAVPPVELVRLAVGYRTRHGYAHHTPASPGAAAAPTWRSWAGQAATDDALAQELGLSPDGRAALQQALARLDSWVQAAASRPLPALLELICLDTLLPACLLAHPHPAHLLAVANALLQFGRDESRRAAHLSVADFLATWNHMAATKEGLPVEQALGSDAARLQLLTAHGAKGLEFERVWVLGCQQSKWAKAHRNDSYKLPPLLQDAPGEKAAEEESRRLFFVAMTRAQEHLTLSYARTDDKGKDSSECLFISELQAAVGLLETVCEVPVAVLEAARLQQLAPPPPPAPLPDPAVLDGLLANFTLSATVLNAYLACPIGCYYEQLLRVPAPRGEALLFGSAVHEALEQHFRQSQRQPEQQFGDANALAAEFAARYTRHRHELPAADFDRRQYAGQTLLRGYYARWHTTWQSAAVIEHSVSRAVVPGGVALKGKLDRLDPRTDGAGHDVLDYKTGKPDSPYAKANIAPASYHPTATLADWHQDEKLRGGNYWRQGIFYHLLLTHDTEARFRPASVSFSYIKPVEKAGQAPAYELRKIAVTPEAEATVLAQIQAVDAAIRNHEFNHGCGDCAWCELRTANS